MTRGKTLPVLALLPLLAAACGGARTAAPVAAQGAPWRYAHDGPAHWAELDPAYRACADGRNQSPVDLAGAQHAPATALEVDYRPGSAAVSDNGHTIEADLLGDAGSIRLGTTRYALVALQFHAPSEHTIGGRGYKMELQLLNRSADGRLAVIAVFIREGRQNAALLDLLVDIPRRGSSRPVELNAADLLPTDRTSFRYTGSLTFPPCTEGVRWIVFKTPIELSRDQILAVVHRYWEIDRPTQPLNGRRIAETG